MSGSDHGALKYLKRKPDGGGAITDINVTPLVDVCLVLVIIFMVISPMVMTSGIEVSGSKVGAAKGEAAIAQNVTVVLDEKGKMTVNGKTVKREDLATALEAVIPKSKDKLVSVDATPKAEVGMVVEILDTAKQKGAKRVALLNR
jgi:biopolymer transport protein ExbD